LSKRWRNLGLDLTLRSATVEDARLTAEPMAA
jgi:hypothetical protein